jgi:iron complex outermembrane receptor protein
VLQGDALDRAKAATLGDTLARMPGVQSSYFGPGVGRPILRGMDGPRVQILSGGIGSMDASTVSADHAASVEPFLADQIEVLKGPATLLFGSGAIGGAVNVVDGRIARELPGQPLSGRAELRGGSGNEERTGMFRLDGVSGNVVLHADAMVRNTGDYAIPGLARSGHEEEEDDGHDHAHQAGGGRLDNSAIRTRAGGLGLAWLGEAGHFGLAASSWRSNYGIPAGAHVHHDDHDGHGHDHAEHDDHDGEDGEAVRIDMVQNRIELKAGLYEPLPFLQRLDLDAGHSDYEHVEWEGRHAGTRFHSRGHEARLEAVQKEVGGWRGAFGLQLGRVDFMAEGEEAFVPATMTRTTGLFALQEKSWGGFKLELGGRYDRVELDPADTQPRRRFDAGNLSAAAIWKLDPALDLRMGVDRSERAPTQEELYANGIHVATGSWEIGANDLDTERALRAELGLHAHNARYDLRMSVYQSRFDDFIYLADTGIEDAGTAVRLWNQADAVFTGAEAELVLHLADAAQGAWDLRLYADKVRARLDGGGSRQVRFQVPHGDHAHDYSAPLPIRGALPRIAPARTGAELLWASGGWRASAGAVRYFAQHEVAANEAPSPGYTLVDAHLSYRWDRADGRSWELFVDGNNLTDRQARPHTSLLRDYAPLPGRNAGFGIRAWF